MNLPSVSIVIPTCNRPEMLNKALDSVLAQDYPNIAEIIITDDDKLPDDLLKEILSRDSRIKYTKNLKYKKGPSGNKQNGIDLANGDFICVLDDDDELFQETISTLIEKSQNKKFDVVFSNCIRSDNGKFTGKHYGKDEEVSYWDFICGKYEGEYFGLSSRFLTKKIKLRDEYGGAEGLGWLGIYKRDNVRLLYVHMAAKRYNVHSGQFSNTYEKNALRTFKSYEKYLELFGEDIREKCPCKYSYLAEITSYFAFLSGHEIEAKKYARLSFSIGKDLKSFIFFLLANIPSGFKAIRFLLILKRKLK